MKLPEQTKADWFYDHLNDVYVAKCSQKTLQGRCHEILGNLNEITTGDCGKVHIDPSYYDGEVIEQ